MAAEDLMLNIDFIVYGDSGVGGVFVEYRSVCRLFSRLWPLPFGELNFPALLCSGGYGGGWPWRVGPVDRYARP